MEQESVQLAEEAKNRVLLWLRGVFHCCSQRKESAVSGRVGRHRQGFIINRLALGIGEFFNSLVVPSPNFASSTISVISTRTDF